MKIWYSPYELFYKTKANSRVASSNAVGALIRVEFSDALLGYADVRPHPELGDLTLQQQLHALSHQTPTLLVKNSLHWALIDAHARKNGENLLKSLSLPKTHALVTDLESTTTEELLQLQQRGYQYLKIKLGRDLERETHWLKNHIEILSHFGLRFDFNESLTDLVFSQWWQQNACRLHQITDYIEDPTPYMPEAWESFPEEPVLALDQALGLESLKSFSGSVVIFKPAKSNTQWLSHRSGRVIFSTYMDHPFGEMTALYAAGKYADVNEVHGLRTWDLLQPNHFTEELSMSSLGPQLQVASGTGFGFNDQLRKLQWKELSHD